MPLRSRLILDCSSLLPGPTLGKLLRKQGARVIKIENPDRPDGAKTMESFYEDLNEDKKIVRLNLTRDEGRSQFHALVRTADGLIEGFRPAAKKKLGLDSPSLHSINPRLCIVSIVGFPESGPYRNRAGHDINFQALSGCASLFGEMPALPLADLFCAYQGAISLVSAMDAATRSGKGTRTVVSMTETLLEVQSGLFREFRKTEVNPLPGHTLFSGRYPCYRIYTSSDGRRISVGAIETKFWERVCAILGVPELQNEGMADGARGREVISQVQAAFGKRDWRDWAPLFENSDCCVEPILNYSEVGTDGLQS